MTRFFDAPSIALAVTALVLAACSSDDPISGDAIDLLASPAGVGGRMPHLAISDNNLVVMSWLESTETGVALRWATLDSGQWQAGEEIARGDNWFVNWADFPSVTPITEDFWAAHWLVRKPGDAYAYDVVAALSTNSGRNWGTPFVVHDDDSATEHGFVTLFAWQGQAGALWLDGRNTNPGSSHEHHSGGMTLRSAQFDADANASYRLELDALVCDCCQTDVAVTEDGPVAVYRNRTENETRDIHVSRFINGQWEADRAIADDGWVIAGCPVNGPAIAAQGSDVAVTWFTAAEDNLRVRLARSDNSGETFGDAIDLDVNTPVGRVDVVQLPHGVTLVSWITESNGQAELVVRSVSADGVAGQRRSIAALSSGRISGFPQMELSGDAVVFAWTDAENGTPSLRSALVSLDTLLDH
ncbi:MAG: hypothetical protein AAGA44_02695 [Pseudomonadota bacterium]